MFSIGVLDKWQNELSLTLFQQIIPLPKQTTPQKLLKHLKLSQIITYLIICAATPLSVAIWYVWSLKSFVAEL